MPRSLSSGDKVTSGSLEEQHESDVSPRPQASRLSLSYKACKAVRIRHGSPRYSWMGFKVRCWCWLVGLLQRGDSGGHIFQLYHKAIASSLMAARFNCGANFVTSAVG